MAARKKQQGSQQITMRIDPAVLDDADDLIPFITERIGLPGTRVDVLRVAVVRGIKELKKERERQNA